MKIVQFSSKAMKWLDRNRMKLFLVLGPHKNVVVFFQSQNVHAKQFQWLWFWLLNGTRTKFLSYTTGPLTNGRRHSIGVPYIRCTNHHKSSTALNKVYHGGHVFCIYLPLTSENVAIKTWCPGRYKKCLKVSSNVISKLTQVRIIQHANNSGIAYMFLSSS